MELLDNRISILATEEQIKNSPTVEEHEPVSREKERQINRYFGWAPYWNGGAIWGNWYNPNQVAIFSEQFKEEVNNLQTEGEQTSNLRSANELKGNVTGYDIKAIDGEVGKVVDFILDDDSWMIHYLIVDTGGWLPGKKVLLSPDSITSINWSDKEISVDLRANEIENGPEYDPKVSFTPMEKDAHRREQERVYLIRDTYLF